MVISVAVLGVMAGALSTVAGMGGGILLLLALALVMGPHAALAATAPALLVSNLHRAFLYRRHLDRRVVTSFALGALPGSIAGGALVAWVSPGWVQAAMLGTTLLAVAQRVGWLRGRPPAALIVPAGAVIGAVSATAGGAGALVSPVLMAAGLAGDAYVAGTSAAAVSMHLGRVVSYGYSGLIDARTLGWSALLVVTLLAGNVLGQRLRQAASARALGVIELTTLVGCTALALAGMV